MDTIKTWLDILVSLHFGMLVCPWFKNVNKSLRKEPKWFLRDWSGIDDPGQRAETFFACHLLKAVAVTRESPAKAMDDRTRNTAAAPPRCGRINGWPPIHPLVFYRRNRNGEFGQFHATTIFFVISAVASPNLGA